MCVLLSCVQLFATPWTVALQAPLFMRFPRQEYWSGFPFHLGDLPNPETKPESLALAGGFFTTEPPGSPDADVSSLRALLWMLFSVTAVGPDIRCGKDAPLST